MSYISVENKVAEQLDMKELAVYTTLKSYMNNETKTCHPSVSSLANDLKCSTNTVRKYLRSIEKKGIIQIEERKIIENGKVWNDTHLYHFFYSRVLQKFKNVTSEVENKLNKSEMSVLDTETLKKNLIEKFNIDIYNKAVQALQRATKRGTIVNNLYSYMYSLCVSIKTQMDLIANVKDTKEVQKRERPSAGNTKSFGKNKFHNFKQRANKYSNEQLLEIIRS